MVLLQRISLRAALVTAVLFSLTFSGCFDKEDAPRSGGGLFQRRGAETVDVTELERYYNVRPPEQCEGCISLRQGGGHAVPSASSSSIVVQMPAADDMFSVAGVYDDASGRVRPILPPDDEGRYEAVLRVLPPENDTVRISVAQYGHNHWTSPVPDLLITDATWNVSLASRTVLDAGLSGHVWLQGTLSDLLHDAEVTYRPDLETLFWLGSHLWGRELVVGERFATHWALPGLFDETLHFRYHVVQVAPGAVPYHPMDDRTGGSRSGGMADAVVRVQVTDAAGEAVHWRLYIDAASPYPVYVERGHHHPMDGASYLPSLVAHQVVLRQRGATPIPWSGAVWGEKMPGVPRGFILGERMAPEALDRLPKYPLGLAVDDLSRWTDFERLRSDEPRLILVEAEYVTRPTEMPSLFSHGWRLVFAGSGGTAYSWEVGRWSLDGRLAPTPVERGPASVTESHVSRFLGSSSGTFRMGLGEATLDAFEDLGAEEADALWYRLELRGSEGLGGRLSASRTLIDDAIVRADDHPLGLVEEDLGAGRLVMVGRFTD